MSAFEFDCSSFPGYAIGIVTENGLEERITGGFRDVENQLPVNEDTRFLVASISKLFTAVGVLQLYEKGKLDLDADINQYVKLNIHHPSGKPISARHLLEHLSGLSDDESGLITWCYDEFCPISLEEHLKEHLIDGAARSHLWNSNYEPGSRYWYSNAGFTVLGYLIEQVSGQGFREYMDENIFLPLNLSQATWDVPPDDNVAIPYSMNLQSYGNYCVAEYPACQLRISLKELSRFLQWFICGHIDGVRLLQPETVKLMLPEDFNHGLGWWGNDTWFGKKHNVWIHGGFMRGVRTQLNYYPTLKRGYIILTNGEQSYDHIDHHLDQLLLHSSK